MNKNIEASEKLFEMSQAGKSPEEMTAELAAMGSTLFVKPGHKFGNAILDNGVGSVELVTVEDGRVVNGDGGAPNDKVYFCGEVYHFADDGVTLVKGEPEKIPAPEGKLPAEVDKSRHPEWAGRDDVIQQTQRGTFVTKWNADGYFAGAVRKED